MNLQNKMRLQPSVFKIPTDKLRAGYYTDRYFLRTQEVLRSGGQNIRVGYQFFPRKDAVICGLDEAIAILKTCAGQYRNIPQAERLYRSLREVQWKLQQANFLQKRSQISKWEARRAALREELNLLWENRWTALNVFALHDGAPVRENEVVLALQGNPLFFVHLETPLLGAIARPTATATAVDRVVRAAKGKQVVFFSARFDHYWTQATDGYAALKAGAFGVSTDANADYWGAQSMGTIPHFLIGCFGGETAEAFLAFDRHTPAEVKRIALVDWDNDCIGTTRTILERLIQKKISSHKLPEKIFLERVPEVVGDVKGKLWGVRFDTSQTLRDKSAPPRGKKYCGVCPELVARARKAFDRWGAKKLKIIVSGGFDEEKIDLFERRKCPVDVYGVGSSLLRKKIDITADIVEYEGRACAKIGREKGDWSKLERVR